MKIILKNASIYRGKKIKKGSKIEVTDGLGYKLIANGLAKKV